MRDGDGETVAIIIPVIDEEVALPGVLRDLQSVHSGPVFVVDGGSRDGTVATARAMGATVLIELGRGYGRACVTGATAAMAAGASILVFLDGDGSDDATCLPALLAPLRAAHADLVIGARVAHLRQQGAMPRHQSVGNHVIAAIMRALYGVPITDLGAFRAIRSSLFTSLKLREMTYGWPVEMIAQAARLGAPVGQVSVPYRPRRGGDSKVSGTLRGATGAAYRMLCTIARERLWPAPLAVPPDRYRQVYRVSTSDEVS